VRLLAAWAATFAVVTYGWLLFGAADLAEIGRSTALLARPWVHFLPEAIQPAQAILIIAATLVCVLGDRLWRSTESVRAHLSPAWAPALFGVLRPAVYIVMVVAMVAEQKGAREFVYLQF
jgi:hypothetical protein